MRIFQSLLIALFWAEASIVSAQYPDPQTLVVLKSYRSAEYAIPGGVIDLAIAVEIKKGWHVNSNRPLADNLIATKVDIEKSKQFTIVETVYPPHVVKRFKFADKPLAVFEGKLLIGIRLKMAGKLRDDTVKVAGTLLYQACNDEVCLLPAQKDFEISIPVSGKARSKALHGEIFSQIKFSKRTTAQK